MNEDIAIETALAAVHEVLDLPWFPESLAWDRQVRVVRANFWPNLSIPTWAVDMLMVGSKAVVDVCLWGEKGWMRVCFSHPTCSIHLTIKPGRNWKLTAYCRFDKRGVMRALPRIRIGYTHNGRVFASYGNVYISSFLPENQSVAQIRALVNVVVQDVFLPPSWSVLVFRNENTGHYLVGWKLNIILNALQIYDQLGTIWKRQWDLSLVHGYGSNEDPHRFIMYTNDDQEPSYRRLISHTEGRVWNTGGWR